MNWWVWLVEILILAFVSAVIGGMLGWIARGVL
jgi:hypothetical protein